MTVLLMAGIGVILAGLAAIGFGIPVKEFGFGNTLILTGTVGICTGLVMISLGIAAGRIVQELSRLADTRTQAPVMPASRNPLRLPTHGLADEADESDTEQAPTAPSVSRERDGAAAGRPTSEPGVPPWQDQVLRDRERLVAAGTTEEPKRRNLLFSSSRRERDKDQSEAAVAQALDIDAGEAAPAVSKPDETRSFDDNWPRNERPAGERPRFSDAIRQAARATVSDRGADQGPTADREPPTAAPERAPGVTVLKSGIVDGMAYSLYSDGSIEAQLPEGMMHFASIDELRAHLDSRA